MGPDGGAASLVAVPLRWRALAPTLALVAVLAPGTAARAAGDDDGEPRLSLPTEADHDAWARAGFRLSLGFEYGRMEGLSGAPSGRLLGPLVRVGVRLDADWSILATFQWTGASSSTDGLSGLRFAGTIDPTWHATRHLSLAIGLGYGGLSEGNYNRLDIRPRRDALEASYTFPSASPPLPSCDGAGPAGLARVEWTWVLGPRSATGLALEALGQWTRCEDTTGRLDPDSGQAIVRRQYWPHTGFTGSWSVTWR